MKSAKLSEAWQKFDEAMERVKQGSSEHLEKNMETEKEITVPINANKKDGELHVRPRLNAEELHTLFRLVNEEYWNYRNRRNTRCSGFFELRRIRNKLRRNIIKLNKKREHPHDLYLDETPSHTVY